MVILHKRRQKLLLSISLEIDWISKEIRQVERGYMNEERGYMNKDAIRRSSYTSGFAPSGISPVLEAL